MKITTIPWEEGFKERLKKNPEYAFILFEKLTKENLELETRLKRACEWLKHVDLAKTDRSIILKLADQLEKPLEEK